MSTKKLATQSILAVFLVLTMLASLTGGSGSAVMAQSGGSGMFSEASAPSIVDDTPDPASISRSRFVNIDLSQLIDSAGNVQKVENLPDLSLNLFPDALYYGKVTQVQKNEDSTTWTGDLVNVENGYFYLLKNDGAFIAHIASPEGVYEISQVGNVYKIIQIDQSKLVDDYPVDIPEGALPAGYDAGPTADSRATIDVLVMYTTSARIHEGSTAAMKLRVALAVTETNQAYYKVGVTTRLRLVHTQEINYTESGNIGTDLNRLKNPSDGYMDIVPVLRNRYGADMVSLIVENGGGYCGLAAAILANSTNPYDVTARSCATGYYSFGHEFGHLQGARHDTYVDPTTSPYSYGHGYTHPNATPLYSWRTIMAYNDKCAAVGHNCTRIQYFSNPTKYYYGAAVGASGVSEVYKVLNTTAYYVANFRTQVIGPNFASQFNGSAAGWTPVKGSWYVNSAYLYSPGISPYLASIKHAYKYGDFTYTAKVKRSSNSPTYLLIRGNPNVRDSSGRWLPSYELGYDNYGEFSVWKVTTSGSVVPLKSWTSSSAIVKGGWNVLKVVAVGSMFKFFINGTLVWVGYDGTYPVGQVGVGIFNNASNQTLWVDYATISTTPTADTFDTVVATGQTLSGGTDLKGALSH